MFFHYISCVGKNHLYDMVLEDLQQMLLITFLRTNAQANKQARYSYHCLHTQSMDVDEYSEQNLVLKPC